MEQVKMTRLEELQSCYWEFYKEVYNVRPRWVDWASLSEADLVKMLDNLAEQSKEVTARKQAEEERAVAEFERTVASYIERGARDRKNAIEWMHQAEETNGDEDYLAYLLNLPFKFFKKAGV